jgi:hypothetical protein
VRVRTYEDMIEAVGAFLEGSPDQKRWFVTNVNKDGTPFVSLFYQKDCGCRGAYHSSCGDDRWVADIPFERERVRVRAPSVVSLQT